MLIGASPTFLKAACVDVLLKLVTLAARMAIITVKTINVFHSLESKRREGDLDLMLMSAGAMTVKKAFVDVPVLVHLAASGDITVILARYEF
jgi:hypothetical protein